MLTLGHIPHDAPMPDLLESTGVIRLLTTAELTKYSRDSLRLWCLEHARYGLPTRELITWLKDFIGDRTSIEIGSGSGDLAFHLNIRATDSRLQDDPMVAAYYRMLRQPVIKYPPFVEKLAASAAIEKYKPQVVVASWVTRWIDETDATEAAKGGNMYGIKEDLIVKSGITYVLIGNIAVHKHKSIFEMEHKEYVFPFVKSRAFDERLDRIWVWN